MFCIWYLQGPIKDNSRKVYKKGVYLCAPSRFRGLKLVYLGLKQVYKPLWGLITSLSMTENCMPVI